MIISSQTSNLLPVNSELTDIIKELHSKCGFAISNVHVDPESVEYCALQYHLNHKIIRSRLAKITPKKQGQFVTFWKRNKTGTIEPFDTKDTIDYCVVNVRYEDKIGQFVFPKSILISKGILSSQKKKGKLAFRLYPSWDSPTNQQSIKTQSWQLNYFFEINAETNYKKVIDLYQS